MIRCEDCEFFTRRADGSPHLGCDPFSNIKEPECLTKWQVYHLTTISRAHQATLDMHRKLAPLQERMFRHMEHELDEADEADSWKYHPPDDDEDDEPFQV